MDINGKTLAKKLREKIKKEILELKKRFNKVPKLVVILIGDYAPSKIYVQNKKKSSRRGRNYFRDT